MQWVNINICPACKCSSTNFKTKLHGSTYKFGNEVILFPTSGIPVVECSRCSLIYKNVVPSPAFLLEVFTQQAIKVWANPYNFFREVNFLKNLTNSDTFDLLDIGAANGELLKACTSNRGRKSALDIIKYPELDLYSYSEFIQGVIDDPILNWGKSPYDVITLFDVIEHLYKPDIAFQNLQLLIKDGGFVVIESGNVESYWPQNFGVNHWWYVKLFEHHVFWSRSSLETIANKYGFQIVCWTIKRHKANFEITFKRKMERFIKSSLYHLHPAGYYNLSLALGKSAFQPGNPIAKDHFQAVLKKTS